MELLKEHKINYVLSIKPIINFIFFFTISFSYLEKLFSLAKILNILRRRRLF